MASTQRTKRQHPCHLSHRLQDQHRWHDVPLRNMPPEKRFVRGDMFQPNGAFIWVELDDAVHEEKRIAMREISLDGQAIQASWGGRDLGGIIHARSRSMCATGWLQAQQC